jgi:hypothetical protein
LGTNFVLGIDKCSVYTGSINKDFQAAAKGDFDDVKKVIKSHPKKVLFTIGLLRTL